MADKANFIEDEASNQVSTKFFCYVFLLVTGVAPYKNILIKRPEKNQCISYHTCQRI